MSELDRMHCEEVIAQLLRYLDGEIDEATRARIDHHLDECRGCFSRAEFEKALKDRVREAGHAQATASLQERIKALIDQF